VTVTVTDGVQTIQTATRVGRGIGDWRVAGLTLPGTYTVTLSRADLTSATVSVSLDESGRITPSSSLGATVTSRGIETVLKSSTAVLYGTVEQRRSRGGARPVGEVTVQLSSGPSSYTVTTASLPPAQLGRYRIEGIPAGTYTVSVSRSGVRPRSEIIELVAGEKGRPYDVTLDEPASVRGRVTRRVEGVEYLVELYRASEYPAVVYRSTHTDVRGRYKFSDVDAPEVYVVQVRRTRGSVPYDSANVTVEPSEAERAPDLVVDR